MQAQPLRVGLWLAQRPLELGRPGLAQRPLVQAPLRANQRPSVRARRPPLVSLRRLLVRPPLQMELLARLALRARLCLLLPVPAERRASARVTRQMQPLQKFPPPEPLVL